MSCSTALLYGVQLAFNGLGAEDLSAAHRTSVAAPGHRKAVKGHRKAVKRQRKAVKGQGKALKMTTKVAAPGEPLVNLCLMEHVAAPQLPQQPAPSRVDQHVAIGMATERSATTRLQGALPRRHRLQTDRAALRLPARGFLQRGETCECGWWFKTMC